MRTTASLFLAGVLLAGCQQPSETILTDDQADLEMFSVTLPDSNIAVASVDTAGVLPEDQVKFGGVMLINQVVVDTGGGKVSAAYARVMFADSAVRFSSRMVGFTGITLGTVRLNGDPLLEVPHRIAVRRDTALTRGVEYLGNLRGKYRPNTSYRFTAFPLMIGTIDESITTPDSLTVLSPTSGSTISRDRDLVLKWQGGRGKLSLVFSLYDPATGKIRPIVQFRSRSNPGIARIPAKFMRQLPPSRLLLVSFILSNRREETIVARYSGKILIQAATVYTSYLELR